MSLFHRHRWTETERSFTEPHYHGRIKVHGYDHTHEALAIIRRANEGATHILLQCQVCGDVRGRTVFGVFASKKDQRDPIPTEPGRE